MHRDSAERDDSPSEIGAFEKICEFGFVFALHMFSFVMGLHSSKLFSDLNIRIGSATQTSQGFPGFIVLTTLDQPSRTLGTELSENECNCRYPHEDGERDLIA